MEEVSLPKVMLLPRPGKLHGIEIIYTQVYDRGDLEYVLAIRDEGATYECAFRARLLQGGKPYNEIKTDLTPIARRRLSRDQGELLFHDAPATLTKVTAALEVAFASDRPYKWTINPINTEDPQATATLTMQRGAQGFAQGLETLLNHLDLDGRSTISAQYCRE